MKNELLEETVAEIVGEVLHIDRCCSSPHLCVMCCSHPTFAYAGGRQP